LRVVVHGRWTALHILCDSCANAVDRLRVLSWSLEMYKIDHHIVPIEIVNIV
jgi:hypothetical protein